jgi:hypothetical protein
MSTWEMLKSSLRMQWLEVSARYSRVADAATMLVGP